LLKKQCHYTMAFNLSNIRTSPFLARSRKDGALKIHMIYQSPAGNLLFLKLFTATAMP